MLGYKHRIRVSHKDRDGLDYFLEERYTKHKSLQFDRTLIKTLPEY